MSKLEQLINELCPRGVEYDFLYTVMDYEQPTKYIVKDAKEKPNGNTRKRRCSCLVKGNRKQNG